jgi:hypothetical protein
VIWTNYTIFTVITGAIIMLGMFGPDQTVIDRLKWLGGGAAFVLYGVLGAKGVFHTFYYSVWFFIIPLVAGLAAIGFLVAGIVAFILKLRRPTGSHLSQDSTSCNQAGQAGGPGSPAMAAEAPDTRVGVAASLQPKYCGSCGAAVVEQTRFCIACGAPLSVSSVAPAWSARVRNPKAVAAAVAGAVCVVTLIGLAAGGVFSRGWGSADELTVRDFRVVDDWAIALIDTNRPDLFNPDQPGMGSIAVLRRSLDGWRLDEEVSYMGAIPILSSLATEGAPAELVDWLSTTMGLSDSGGAADPESASAATSPAVDEPLTEELVLSLVEGSGEVESGVNIGVSDVTNYGQWATCFLVLGEPVAPLGLPTAFFRWEDGIWTLVGLYDGLDSEKSELQSLGVPDEVIEGAFSPSG